MRSSIAKEGTSDGGRSAGRPRGGWPQACAHGLDRHVLLGRPGPSDIAQVVAADLFESLAGELVSVGSVESSGSAGWLLPADGSGARTRRSGRRLDIRVDAFGKLTARQSRELDDQVDRVAEIRQGRPELTIGPVNIGSHL